MAFDEEEGLELRRQYGDSLVWANGQTSLLTFQAEALDFLGPYSCSRRSIRA